MNNYYQLVKLKDIVKFTNGGAWSQSEYDSSGIPVVRVSDIHDGKIDLADCKYLPRGLFEKYKDHVLHKNDLVVCTVGSHPTQPNSVVGRTAIITQNIEGALLNQNAVRIVSKVDFLDNRWLGYFSQTSNFKNYIINHARGSANQVRMSIGELQDMDIALPPYVVQCKIATVLSGYDYLIDNNLRRITILEEMVQNLYKDWFVNFHFPGYKKVKNVDSALGMIPEGWEIVNLGDFIDFVRGIEPGGKNYLDSPKDGYVPFLRVGDLGDRKSTIFVNKSLVGDKMLNKMDIALTLDGTVGIVRLGLEGAYSTGIRKLVIRDSTKITWAYLYCLLQSKYIQDIIKANSKGTTIIHAGSATEKMIIALPPIELLGIFELSGTSLLKLMINLGNKMNLLHQTRDMLLSKLISGEIDVSDLDIEGRESA